MLRFGEDPPSLQGERATQAASSGQVPFSRDQDAAVEVLGSFRATESLCCETTLAAFIFSSRDLKQN